MTDVATQIDIAGIFDDRPRSTAPAPDLMGVFREELSRVSTTRVVPLNDDRASIDELIEWLDSEDFGNDPGRIRAEAWR